MAAAQWWQRRWWGVGDYLLSPTRLCFQTIYNLIGEAQYRMANYEEAESWFKKALELQPAMVHAHLFYGKMLAKNVGDDV